MASYAVNDAAVRRARELIVARQYVLESDWGEVQPRADAETRSSRSLSSASRVIRSDRLQRRVT